MHGHDPVLLALNPERADSIPVGIVHGDLGAVLKGHQLPKTSGTVQRSVDTQTDGSVLMLLKLIAQPKSNLVIQRQSPA